MERYSSIDTVEPQEVEMLVEETKSPTEIVFDGGQFKVDTEDRLNAMALEYQLQQCLVGPPAYFDREIKVPEVYPDDADTGPSDEEIQQQVETQQLKLEYYLGGSQPSADSEVKTGSLQAEAQRLGKLVDAVRPAKMKGFINSVRKDQDPDFSLEDVTHPRMILDHTMGIDLSPFQVYEHNKKGRPIGSTDSIFLFDVTSESKGMDPEETIRKKLNNHGKSGAVYNEVFGPTATPIVLSADVPVNIQNEDFSKMMSTVLQQFDKHYDPEQFCEIPSYVTMSELINVYNAYQEGKSMTDILQDEAYAKDGVPLGQRMNVRTAIEFANRKKYSRDKIQKISQESSESSDESFELTPEKIQDLCQQQLDISHELQASTFNKKLNAHKHYKPPVNLDHPSKQTTSLSRPVVVAKKQVQAVQRPNPLARPEKKNIMPKPKLKKRT